MATDTSSLLPHEQRLPPRKDLWTAVAFLVLGLAIISLSTGPICARVVVMGVPFSSARSPAVKCDNPAFDAP